MIAPSARLADARQAHALPGARAHVLGVAAVLQRKLGAPGRLAGEACRAVAAAHQWHRRHEVAGGESGDALSERHHLAGELVPEHVAGLLAEGRVLGHVQVGPADAATSHLQHDFARTRLRVRQALHAQRLVQPLHDRCFHHLNFPSAMPPSMSTWLPVIYDEASRGKIQRERLDLPGLGDAPERHLLVPGRAHHRISHPAAADVGHEGSRCDGIHADAVFGELHRDVPHHVREARLGRHVGHTDDGLVHDRGIRRRGDDRAGLAARLHHPCRLADGVVHAGQVDRDAAVPARRVHGIDLAIWIAVAGRIPETRTDIDAGIGEADVEPAKCGDMRVEGGALLRRGR